MFGKNAVAGKRTRTDGYLVHSIFYTIQGEGPLAGTPAIFVRLAGCNLRCLFCDTEFEKGSTVQGLDHLLYNIERVNPRFGCDTLVVITGGEPMLQPLPVLIGELIRRGYQVQIETAGTVFPEDDTERHAWVWHDPLLTVVVSPKTLGLNKQVIDLLPYYKYIIKAGEVDQGCDGLPVDVFKTATVPYKVFVQPCDEQDEIKNKANLAAAVQSSMKFGHRLSIQLHKIAGLE